MKIKIKQKILMDLLTKGAIAATNELAQTDNTPSSFIIKSIKIECEKEEFSIASSSPFIIGRSSVAVGIDDGLIVHETGAAIVQAKELMDWVKMQKSGSIINMESISLKTPETIEFEEEDSTIVTKIGQLKLSSRDLKKTGSKWSLDCYDESVFPFFPLETNNKIVINSSISTVKDIIDKLSISASPRDPDHIEDSISVQMHNDNLYFLTSSTGKVGTYMIDIASLEDKEGFVPFFIPISCIDAVCKVSDKDSDIKIVYDDTSYPKIHLLQQGFHVIMQTVERSSVSRFIDVKLIEGKEYKSIADINKDALLKDLNIASIVNKHSALIRFNKKEDKGIVTVEAISEEGKYRPSLSTSDAEELFNPCDLVWNIAYVSLILKRLSSENISVKIIEKSKTAKITGNEEPHISYISSFITNQKYINLIKEYKEAEKDKESKEDEEE